MPKQVKRTSKSAKSGILSRTKLYGFELFMSTIGLLAISFVVDYGIFSLFRHFSQSAVSFRDSDEVVLFLVAAMIVWLPVASLFYLRSRGEFRISPKEAQTKVHKVLVSVYMVINTVVAIGATFYVVYVALQLAVGTSPGETNSVLRQIIPGILMALWHGWMLFAFTNRRIASARMFAIGYAIITILVILTLFVVTADGIRSRSTDQRKEADLSLIQAQINRSFDDNEQLPTSLEDVEASGLSNSLSDYTYKLTDSKHYKLCAEFILNTIPPSPNQNNSTYSYNDGYTNYPDWSAHTSGQYCYEIVADDLVTYDEPDNLQPSAKAQAE